MGFFGATPTVPLAVTDDSIRLILGLDFLLFGVTQLIFGLDFDNEFFGFTSLHVFAKHGSFCKQK